MSTESIKKKNPKARAKAPVKPPLVRGEAIVQRVHEAAVLELAAVGYRALRMEEVAVRAEVNKTTVYRRWPTKAELVRDALATTSASKFVLPNTGTLRSDLLAVARMFVKDVTSPLGQSVVRMMMAESADPEIADICRSLRRSHEGRPQAMIARAVARGEVAPETDFTVLFDALIGALHHRLFFMFEDLDNVDETFLAKLIDLLLEGALHPKARKAQARRAAQLSSS